MAFPSSVHSHKAQDGAKGPWGSWGRSWKCRLTLGCCRGFRAGGAVASPAPWPAEANGASLSPRQVQAERVHPVWGLAPFRAGSQHTRNKVLISLDTQHVSVSLLQPHLGAVLPPAAAVMQTRGDGGRVRLCRLPQQCILASPQSLGEASPPGTQSCRRSVGQ